MKYRELITRSRASLGSTLPTFRESVSAAGFGKGAKWMFEKLNGDHITAAKQFNGSINYSAYGFLKYGISLFVMLGSALLLAKFNVLLVPLSVVFFYIAEVHFLFLFPVLMDDLDNPILTSIKKTYSAGFLTALFTVIPIGIFMMWGLLNFKDPFRNWYVGCLAIVIWYKDEVRNRI